MFMCYFSTTNRPFNRSDNDKIFPNFETSEHFTAKVINYFRAIALLSRCRINTEFLCNDQPLTPKVELGA